MDLRLLECFVAVAELEHVGKAAERLHVSQSPLSRQIRRLEDELQLQLFDRERQRIRLNESGKWLLSQARGLLAQADRIRDEAEQRTRGKSGTLSITFMSGAMWSGLLPRALRRFQAECPEVNLELRNMRSALQIEEIRSGRVDVGFVSRPYSGGNVESTCVSREPFVLVVPCEHRLARKRKVAPRDVETVRWILLTESLNSGSLIRFSAACANVGFTPQSIQRVAEPATLLALVASGVGVGLMRSSARHYAPPSLTFKALPWFPHLSRTYMIRRTAERQPLVKAFTAYVREIQEDS